MCFVNDFDDFVVVVNEEFDRRLALRFVVVVDDDGELLVLEVAFCLSFVVVKVFVVIYVVEEEEAEGKKIFSESCVLSMISMILPLLEMGLFVFF